MKETHFVFVLIIVGVILGMVINEWDSYQWCRSEECINGTKWTCNRTNNFEAIHWIVISILTLFGIWKFKETIY